MRGWGARLHWLYSLLPAVGAPGLVRRPAHRDKAAMNGAQPCRRVEWGTCRCQWTVVSGREWHVEASAPGVGFVVSRGGLAAWTPPGQPVWRPALRHGADTFLAGQRPRDQGPSAGGGGRGASCGAGRWRQVRPGPRRRAGKRRESPWGGGGAGTGRRRPWERR